jgi:hypothetical protein
LRLMGRHSHTSSHVLDTEALKEQRAFEASASAEVLKQQMPPGVSVCAEPTGCSSATESRRGNDLPAKSRPAEGSPAGGGRKRQQITSSGKQGSRKCTSSGDGGASTSQGGEGQRMHKVPRGSSSEAASRRSERLQASQHANKVKRGLKESLCGPWSGHQASNSADDVEPELRNVASLLLARETAATSVFSVTSREAPVTLQGRAWSTTSLAL